MARDVRAKYSNGKLELLEALEDVEEGAEVIVSVKGQPFSKERWDQLKKYAQEKAKEAGITSEEQVVELIHEQRRNSSK